MMLKTKDPPIELQPSGKVPLLPKPRHLMRPFVRRLLTVAGIALAFSGTAPASGDFTLIEGVNTIDVTGTDDGARDILLNGEFIEAVEMPGGIHAPPKAEIVDGRDLYAIPGLWDMHMHVTAVAELEDRIFPLLIANGVTSVRDLGGMLEPALEIRQRSRRAASLLPTLYIAGPVIDGIPRVYEGSIRGANESSLGIDTPEQAIALVDKLAAAGVDLIKPYEMLRPEPFKALVARANQHRLPATGHVPIRMTVGQALDAGLNGIEHLRGIEFDCAENPEELLAQRTAIMDAHDQEGGGMQLRRSVHATVRPPALDTQDPERCAALIEQFVKAGTWHTPTLHFVGFRALGLYKDPAWLDAYRYLPPGLRERRLKLLEEFTDESKYTEWADHGRWAVDILGRMNQAGVSILAGTDSPGFIFMPGFTLHDELEALVTAGLTEREALKAATASPAQFFDAMDEAGTISAGKRADLLLLEANPLENIRNTRRIAAVIVKGRVLDRSDLDAMLAPFESRAE